MKKSIIVAALIAAIGSISANAQVIEQPKFFDNWSIGIEGGAATPLDNHIGGFFGDMRAAFGLHFNKQLTPVFGTGIEGAGYINTSSWSNRVHSRTGIDESYVGVYGTADLMELFGGYSCKVRPFTIQTVLGAGWGHYYFPHQVHPAVDMFVTKAGLNFNFNTSERFSIALKPFVSWNMEGPGHVAYDKKYAAFNIMAGISYRLSNKGFTCATPDCPYTQADIDALNAAINAQRAENQALQAQVEAQKVQNTALATELEACQNRKPEVVKEVTVNNQLNSVRFVFFRIGSKVVTGDQMPNVEMIADYMKKHPEAKVVIKGYASKDGGLDRNIALAAARAEAVKDVLVSKFKIAANRITAEGQGIGDMFEEDSWNRVSICTLEEAKK